ncbi:unnamed protein product [Allacma fusca]|uniref:Uncharacterized protein n=1 Tax=Allacma fusca TaxID=39272 RepID=A0A8J2PHI5_9HEXA|nr:unnamed protein product [Allacma fusca]
MDSELSDNSPLASSQPDQENIYTLQQTHSSLNIKPRSKELTFLEAALLRLIKRNSSIRPFHPFASEEAVSSIMLTGDLIVTPPSSSFWSG